MRHRRNPVTIGKHPSLFGGETPVLVDWRDMSPDQIAHAVAAGTLPAEDWNEMVDARELSESTLLREGVNPALARALAEDDDFMDRLEEADELGRQERIKPLVAAIQVQALSDIEYATESRDGQETYIDLFQSKLPSIVRRLSREMLQELKDAEDYPGIADVTLDMMEQVMSDPDIYEISISKSEYGRTPPASYTIRIGATESSLDGLPTTFYKDLSDADVAAAVKELEDAAPFIRFYRPPQTARDFRHAGFRIGETEDWRFVFSPKLDAVIAALDDITGASTKVSEPYDVVYRYSGSNSTVAGASAKGMYVAKLLPSQLKRIGAALGICVGREDMGYRRRLVDGKIELYAILTEADKPKFCIERLVSTAPLGSANAIGDIYQVKGKANRLPGFEPNKSDLTKPDEVRLVVEFLMTMEFSVRQIAQMRDIGPGVRTMLENGIDPSLPPPVGRRRQAPPAAENPALMPSAATAAMIREDYAQPWGGRWGT